MNATMGLFVKERRRRLGLTQPELADRAGVGLRFIRELERGKPSVRVDKVNQVLSLFGHQLTPTRSTPPEGPSHAEG